ncbi:MAG TPA: DUF547 domain-containing protein [Candidatus Polarisedimenticolia bacterium]|nr:DUF547 domain-containing protein [Candidatus Polarisedimenticolia bacterium]
MRGGKAGTLTRQAGSCTLLSIALMLSSLAGSCAPKAVAIQGEASETIRRGIASGQGSFDHAAFSRVLSRHSRDMGRRFDYDGLKARPEDLETYLKSIAGADLAALSRDELLALLINAYNAFTIDSILGTYKGSPALPVASIRDIPDVFSRKAHIVGGYKLSLDNLEHGLIRPLFKDPRAHFVVNCASVSCAPLPPEALTGTRLQTQLEAAARGTLSSPDYLRVENGRLRVTKLLDWYGSDFVSEGFRGAEKNLPRYLRKYATEEVVRFIDSAGGNPPYDFMDYDWTLNRAATLRLAEPGIPRSN